MELLFKRGSFWEDPSVILTGALQPHATLWPFSHETDARKPDAVFGTDSDRYHNLNGLWKFGHFSRACDVPEAFYSPEYDVSCWDEQPVPGCWQMDREKNYDIPHYMGNSYMYQLDPPYVGNTPGKTSQINYFRIDNKAYLVDLPGYGYAKVSQAERDRWGSSWRAISRMKVRLSRWVCLLWTFATSPPRMM